MSEEIKDHENDEIYSSVVDGLDSESYIILCEGYLAKIKQFLDYAKIDSNDYLLEIKDYTERLARSYEAYILSSMC